MIALTELKAVNCDPMRNPCGRSYFQVQAVYREADDMDNELTLRCPDGNMLVVRDRSARNSCWATWRWQVFDPDDVLVEESVSCFVSAERAISDFNDFVHLRHISYAD